MRKYTRYLNIRTQTSICILNDSLYNISELYNRYIFLDNIKRVKEYMDKDVSLYPEEWIELEISSETISEQQVSSWSEIYYANYPEIHECLMNNTWPK